MRAVALSVAALIAACSRNLELLPDRDGAAGASGMDTRADTTLSCSGLGPAIALEIDGVARCAGALEAASHRYALCVCSALELEPSFRSDAFDSTGLTGSDKTTAAVGVNGDLSCSATVEVGGAVHASGPGGAEVSASFQTVESLRLAGPLAAGDEVRVGADAYVGGNVSGEVTVAGALHTPEEATVDATVQSSLLVREPVSVPAPCDCSSRLVDVAGAVSAAGAANDNLAVGLSTDAFTGSTSPPSTLDLPCGRFFVSAIELSSDLKLNVHGRAELAVLGDVTIRGALDVNLDSGAELDLVLGGTLAVSGGRIVGSKAAPARFRIWTVSTEDLLFEDDPIVGAVIYAPHAGVIAPAGIELFGSLLAARFSPGGPVVVHYDRSVLAAGVPCGAPAQAAVH
jgi:hypothetical protein